MMSRRLGVFLEMKFLDFLPASHNTSATTELDFASPDGVEVLVVDCADKLGVTRERRKVVAAVLVVVIGHSVCKPADNGFGDV